LLVSSVHALFDRVSCVCVWGGGTHGEHKPAVFGVARDGVGARAVEHGAEAGPGRAREGGGRAEGEEVLDVGRELVRRRHGEEHTACRRILLVVTRIEWFTFLIVWKINAQGSRLSCGLYDDCKTCTIRPLAVNPVPQRQPLGSSKEHSAVGQQLHVTDTPGGKIRCREMRESFMPLQGGRGLRAMRERERVKYVVGVSGVTSWGPHACPVPLSC